MTQQCRPWRCVASSNAVILSSGNCQRLLPKRVVCKNSSMLLKRRRRSLLTVKYKISRSWKQTSEPVPPILSLVPITFSSMSPSTNSRPPKVSISLLFLLLVKLPQAFTTVPCKVLERLPGTFHVIIPFPLNQVKLILPIQDSLNLILCLFLRFVIKYFL